MEPWWGKSTLDDDQPRCWRIDSTALWVQRLASEWRVAWASNGAADVEHGAGASLLELPNVARFGVEDSERTLSLLPALADRPVVSRPEKPFSVPPGNTVTIFIGTPLWMQLTVGKSRTSYQATAGWLPLFKAEKKNRELTDIAAMHGLEAAALQAFVDEVLRRRIFDGERLSELMAPLNLGWKARTQAELALVEDKTA